MDRSRYRLPDVAPELMARVLALLATNTAQSRAQAMQILAAGYAHDEERRQAELSEAERPDGYHESQDWDRPPTGKVLGFVRPHFEPEGD